MSKSLLSFVWVAGPLSGLIMQPVVGVWSDKCVSQFGRRRPFMVVGSLIVGLSLMLMAWTREFVDIFVWSERWAPTVTICFAVLSVFFADFAVNAVQACCRAIIVDTLPKSKQEMANAWAGRMVAGGHLVGYFAGVINLVEYFPYLGNNQLKVLCAISSFALLVCVGLTSWAVEERVMTLTDEADKSNSLYHILRTLLHTGFHLPRRIRQIFMVQVFAWYGWFTFLFYASTWVGYIYVRYDSADLKDSTDIVGDIGRVGSLALTFYSTVTLICSLILPFCISSPNSDKAHYQPSSGPFSAYRPTLPTAWMVGEIVYAFAMFCTFFVRSVRGATFIVAICGFSWSLTSWAPFSLLAEEIRKLNVSRNTDGYQSLSTEDDDRVEPADTERSIETPRKSRQIVGQDREDLAGATPITDGLDPLSAIDSTVTEDLAELSSSSSLDQNSEEEESSEQAGIYLGLHNVSITLPQFVSTFISFIVFSLIDPGQSNELTGGDSVSGVDSIGVTLRIGALTALASAYMANQLRQFN
ncbi:hypothetical protein V1512DRAFT_268902 [Lipomyces arxii]|uniref:uncharacterized protein n=1 Tax=Lipomyces arxii TaxID=56418 RepID=UPI0034CE913A